MPCSSQLHHGDQGINHKPIKWEWNECHGPHRILGRNPMQNAAKGLEEPGRLSAEKRKFHPLA